MTTLTFPAGLIPNQVTWHLEPNTAAFVSPLSRSVQTLELPGARWVCSMTLPTMQPSAWRTWTAFLAKMRGQAGRVYYGPPQYRGITAPTWTADPSALTADSTTVTADSTALVNQESATGFGSPVVDGADQSGAYLRTSGWTRDVQVMAAGDYLSYDTTRGRSLHMVVDDVRSDAAGVATLRIEPPIRTAPADGASIETDSPTCIMALKDGMTGAPTWTPYLRAAVNVELVEVF
jgi:hypothetical protein